MVGIWLSMAEFILKGQDREECPEIRHVSDSGLMGGKRLPFNSWESLDKLAPISLLIQSTSIY
jgi:hypothetical protein